MKSILLVGAGGFVGAILRYKLGGMVLHHTANWKFPMGTFVVNVCGCLAAGVLMALAVKHDLLSATTRLVVFTGLLGGFTTFSAFGLETVYLLERQETLTALLYAGTTLAAGILVLWLAMSLIK